MAFQSAFGAGYLWGTLAGGTPRLFAALQDVTVTFSKDLKPLHGQGSYPLEHGGGKGKIEAKASVGRFDPKLCNELFWGGVVTTGQTLASNLEAGTVPASAGPYTITVANSATWASDLGVYDQTAGKFLTKVASGPTTGQYSVAAGVYTFAAADTLHPVNISYTYTSAAGFNVASGNPLIGAVNIFRADLFNTYRGVSTGISLLACQSSKLDFPFKQDDFMLPAFDFMAQDDGTGQVFKAYGVGNN